MNSRRNIPWIARTVAAISLLACGAGPALADTGARGPVVVIGKAATPREQYAAERLRATLTGLKGRPPSVTIRVGVRGDAIFGDRAAPASWTPGESEAFTLERRGNEIAVIGSDSSGALYGAMELSERIARTGRVPTALSVSDRPGLKIRGTNLFWMKFGEQGYNWALTPEHFPWFFDRDQMARYLDELVDTRYNTIFFWTAHPFPFLLRLARYPEAQSLDDADLQRNMDQFRWFTEEADRRGIWTVLHFYNIHVPPSFAKAHAADGVRIENRQATPLLLDYTRYCVSEFVKSYPNVGLMLTAGEALTVAREEFIRDAVVAGIKDSGKHPPLIVRQWTISPSRFRDIVKPSYTNLFTMMKHNTEMLVSPYPEARNRTWVKFGDHIINVHENADLKPFRWGSPLFIRETVEHWKEIGVAGFHLYPMVSWQWPVSLDSVTPRLSTVDRDWIWLQAFGRYGWNADRDPAQEKAFWIDRLADRFGPGPASAALYDYYVKTGPVLPGLQNVINIYNMNFHPTAVGQEATLNGILRSDRWNYVDSPLAEPLDAYSIHAYEAQYGPLTPEGRRRPPRSIKEIVHNGRPGADAVDPLRLASLFISMVSDAADGLRRVRPSRNLEEYDRFVRDAEIELALAKFYAAKLEAAYEKGLYDATGDERHLDAMLTELAESVRHYTQVERVASAAYRQATDLAEWYRWSTTLENFKDELRFYQSQRALRTTGADVVYLGLDGPMSDASNVFHWLLEQDVVKQGWRSQSYAFSGDYLRNAKLAVLYETRSEWFRREQQRLLDWVGAGGKLVVWDPLARACALPLFEGLSFWSDESYLSSPVAGFSDLGHPLLNGLRGDARELDGVRVLNSSVRSATADWTELAYTVLHPRGRDQFWYPHRTFGPRWTSILNPARVPIMLTRKMGRGEIVLMQIGVAMSSPKRTVGPDPGLGPPPPHMQAITSNIVSWAGQQPKADGREPVVRRSPAAARSGRGTVQ